MTDRTQVCKTTDVWFSAMQKIAVFTYHMMPLRLSRSMLHGWKDNSMLVKHLAACTHLRIFNSFPVIRTASAKNRRFHVPQHTFLFLFFPGDAPAIITQYVVWMERQLNACQSPRSMYPSVFNSFPVIRTTIAKKSSFFAPRPSFFCYISPICQEAYSGRICTKFAISIYLQQFPNYSNRKCIKSPFSRTTAHIFVSPGDTPAIITQYMLHGWKDNSMLARPLRTPWGNHAKCCMDGKRIRSLQIISLNVPI